MKFHDPVILWRLLWVWPVIALFLFWAERSYRKAGARFAEKNLIPHLVPLRTNRKRTTKALLDLTVILLTGVALAGPQWGYAWKQKPPAGVDVLFAIDLSKSMLAGDVPPDRLSYVKQEVRTFIDRLSGDRVGLIGFAGKAFLFCPLTPDYGGFLITLDGLDTGSVPRGGTAIASAIDEAVRALSPASSDEKALVLISDGEETEPDAIKTAEAAKQAHVQISCIGIGTPEGSVIVSDGTSVRSRLNETLLRSISETTGGIYVRAKAGDFGLEKIVDERLSKMKKRQADESLSRSYEERYQYPLALAVLLLLASTTVSMTRGHEKD